MCLEIAKFLLMVMAHRWQGMDEVTPHVVLSYSLSVVLGTIEETRLDVNLLKQDSLSAEATSTAVFFIIKYIKIFNYF